jgi:hypothetical protein
VVLDFLHFLEIVRAHAPISFRPVDQRALSERKRDAVQWLISKNKQAPEHRMLPAVPPPLYNFSAKKLHMLLYLIFSSSAHQSGVSS